ncbi:adenosylcobinamide-GDP ribazoletransferase [Noviherbaspirillum sedimenti]|uniref:Adenosylcobinamide-GDP ribazoletransferase n=1 Tax=Noviherbaspirillum sedimenti TaxID=2320865 RepID=A0A3A3G0M1_9BURK|nr:adenosylcobinamide-GDP ribazoletransferase [Noviherbaspirillum sedimenti]RJG01471.1 adenosylcobinamide-GDP ribazoletransferase [Noviherbaspirillum sedimenti]
MLQTANPSISLRARCIHQVRLFFVALQFFTRIPIPRWVGFDPAWLHHASRYYPLVGLVVAAATSAVYLLAALFLPQLVAVLLSTITGIYLTGAFHEDGFADVCDGFGGGMTPARVLEIMTDSRVGAYGAIGIGLLLLLKCATLFYLPVQAVIAALLIAHPLSRMISSVFIWRLDYVKGDGKAKPLAHRMSTAEMLIAALTAAMPILLMGFAGWISWYGILAGMAAAGLMSTWLGKIFMRRIGGYTGDCLGAVQQVAEVAFYLGVLACMGNGILH